MERVFIALGSNLGDRAVNLAQAITRLNHYAKVLRRSPIYETAPMYVTDQPMFLNMVVEIETDLQPTALLESLKNTEKELGREGGVRYGPRLIDLDILFYGDRVVNQPQLTIPHSGIAERRYVLRPLCDLAPDLVHPISGSTMAKLLSELPDDNHIELFAG